MRTCITIYKTDMKPDYYGKTLAIATDDGIVNFMESAGDQLQQTGKTIKAYIIISAIMEQYGSYHGRIHHLVQ